MNHNAIRKRDGIVDRRIHGSFFLIDITDKYSNDRCAIFEVNEMGKFIWDHIDGHRSMCDLANVVKSAIIEDVEYNVILDDVNRFVKELAERNFLEV